MLCRQCRTEVSEQSAVCPKCGAEQACPGPVVSTIADQKKAAAICAILLGEMGIHKFVLGYTREGVIMLLVTVLTFGYGALIVWPIGIIEGIIYLRKSDEEFERIYLNNKRRWF